MVDVTRYMAIPYVPGEASLSGADCWGLVRLVYQDHLRVSLPAASEIGEVRDMFLPVEGPQDFDVFLAQTPPYRLHTGLWLSPGILHMSDSGVSYSPLSRFRYRIEGWYCFKAL